VTNRRRSQAQVETPGDTRGMAEWISIYRTYNAIFKLTELSLLPHGLSLPQLHLLGVLRDGGGILTTGEIGREMVKASQTITGLVDRLEVQGFVERQFDRRDRRKTWVRITESGSRKLEEAMPVASRIAQELSTVLTDKELADLQAKIQKLLDAAMDRLDKALARP
jgi:MarR family 2-MHQ and catechol resistance regulon transcriptional repressor